jgi:hypothetical protein
MFIGPLPSNGRLFSQFIPVGEVCRIYLEMLSWLSFSPSGFSFVGCRHIYMQRQPLVELFDNIYYNRTVYTDVLE